MDLYTLNPNFLPQDIIDQFTSAIWTDRYSQRGDVQLTLAPTPLNIERLKPGTYLALRGSKEVMEIQTHEIDKGLLKVSGVGLLEAVFNRRYAWYQNPAASSPESRVSDLTQEKVPGQFLADIVDSQVINPVPFVGPGYEDANLDWELEVIPGLALGAVDTSGVAERLTATVDYLYASLVQVAVKYGVGMSLYLDDANPLTGYVIKFTTYRGRDLTSDQTIYPLVRLSPDLDEISDIKEVHSNALYKNVAYVYYQGEISKHLAEPTLPEPEGLDRRVLVTNAEKEPVGHKEIGYNYYGGTFNRGSTYEYTIVGPEDIVAFREQNAKDAFANNNYIHAIDGQTSPISEYTYGVDYGLGDVIEIQGLTGAISKARITEYIRSQDQYGERNYPTISVINDEE